MSSSNKIPGDNPLAAFARRPPALQGGVDLAVDLLDPRHARLLLEHHGARADLRAAYLSVPYPSGLRRFVAQHPDADAVIVDHLPAGLMRAAEEAGVGVLDSRGYGRLVAPGLVYVAPPPPARSSAKRSSASPFAPKASRIVRGLLADPVQRWRVSDLANLVQVDVGNAHRILASLLEIGVVERDEESYVVVDPGSLLEAWAESHRPPPRGLLVASADLVGDLHGMLAAVSGEGVVSGEFAAELYAPHFPGAVAVLHCFSSAALELLEQADEALRFAPDSARRIVVDVSDAGAAQFGSNIHGLPVAHPAQVYVDLFRSRGRGREAAEHLRRERLRY